MSNMKYSRQELYKHIGKEGQELLSKKHVVIVGAGALGSVAAELLARAGVGKITVIDRDYIEEHNLQRQSLYGEADVGKAKAKVAEEHLKAINKDVEVKGEAVDLNYETIALLKSDLVLDGTDNLTTRFLINEYCKKNKQPWIYAAALEDEGYVKVYLPEEDCFACTFTATTGLESCDTAGVLNTIIHGISSMQVTEALKVLLGKEIEKKLLHLNMWQHTLEKVKTQKKESCPTCQGKYEYLTGKHEETMMKFCGSGTYQIRGKEVNLKQLQEKLSKLGEVTPFDYGLHFQTLTIFKDGRVLVKAQNEKEAKSFYAQYIGT